MGSSSLVKTWAVLSGAILVIAGVLGFIDNPIVGKADGALIATNELHNVVHILTGVLALWIGLGLRGAPQATAMVGFGALYTIVLIATIVSPDLVGLFAGYAAGPIEHLVHGGLAVVSIGVGLMGRPGMTEA
jgi:hypothetical protein